MNKDTPIYPLLALKGDAAPMNDDALYLIEHAENLALKIAAAIKTTPTLAKQAHAKLSEAACEELCSVANTDSILDAPLA